MLRLVLLAAILLLAGCMVGPDYQRPQIDIPQGWRTADGEKHKGTIPLVDSGWWEQLGDPVLDNLITIAITENKDLLIAAARVEQFAAQYGIIRADLFPQASAGAQYERQRSSEKSGNPLATIFGSTKDTFSATLNASWEIDIWGRVRRSSEAAKAQLLATEEGRQAVILSLVSSVAGSYVNLLALDRQLKIAQDTAQSRKESLDLFQKRFKHGYISEMELYQAKTIFEESLATIPQIEKAIAQQENGLNILLGRNPGPVARGKTIDRLILPTVPEGLPSELLIRRPDIRQAEQNLIAANAQIGVARAAYFPAISLTGMFGSASVELSDLFTGPARVWSYGGSLTVPIFTAGKISGNVKASEAQKEQALISYKQTIQNAFSEVDNSLVDQKTTREQLSIRSQQVVDLQGYLRLANMRYENGYSNYLDVLDAERNLFSAQLNYVQNQQALFQALINLYKAMGGGWINVADGLPVKSDSKTTSYGNNSGKQ